MSTRRQDKQSISDAKDDGCCSVLFLKYVLFIFNTIFLLSGLGVLGVGIWTLIAKSSYVSLLSTSLFSVTTYILIAVGTIVIVIALLGCFAAFKENRVGLMVYATLLFLVFLMEAIAGVLAYMYNNAIHDELERNLNNTMIQWYHFDEAKTAAITQLQRNFHCCGAGSFEDWKYSRWLKEAREKNTTHAHNKAPDSCCKTESPGCAIRDHPSNINYNGCLPALEFSVKQHLIILGAVGIGICFLQIFGIIFACCLAKRIKDFKYKEVQVQYAYPR